jgi:hypothetical protein
LRPLNGVLVMEQLHYADEVRPNDRSHRSRGEVKATELALAKQLIAQTAAETFEPAKYKDTVRERVLETIQRKVDGQDITSGRPAPTAAGKIIDLMEALKASPRREPETRSGRQSLVILKPAPAASRSRSGKGRSTRTTSKTTGCSATTRASSRRRDQQHVLSAAEGERDSEWAAQVPDHFTFTIKASQRITHFARIKPESASALEYLLKTTVDARRAARSDPVQLPPNMKKDLDAAARISRHACRAIRRFTIEFRHESWFEDDVYDALRERDVPMCVIDQPDLLVAVRVDRVVGIRAVASLRYDDDALATWAKRIAASRGRMRTSCFKHDEGVGSGPPAVDAFIRATSAA